MEENQRNLTIYLTENSNDLAAVKVTAGRDTDWERTMKIFERELIGSGYSKKEVHIVNREVVEFANNSNLKKNFTAKAKQALTIENRHLGYNYIGFLTNFEKTNTQTKYTLSGYFEPIQPKDFKEMVQWIRRRRSAYEGSLRHFLKSFIDNRMEEEGFFASINVGGKNVPFYPQQYLRTTPDSLVLIIDFPGLINCYYRSPRLSAILKPQSTIYCNKEGLLFNPLSLETNGKMSEMRMADELPTDYMYLSSFKKEKTIEEELFYLKGKIH